MSRPPLTSPRRTLASAYASLSSAARSTGFRVLWRMAGCRRRDISSLWAYRRRQTDNGWMACNRIVSQGKDWTQTKQKTKIQDMRTRTNHPRGIDVVYRTHNAAPCAAATHHADQCLLSRVDLEPVPLARQRHREALHAVLHDHGLLAHARRRRHQQRHAPQRVLLPICGASGAVGQEPGLLQRNLHAGRTPLLADHFQVLTVEANRIQMANGE